MAFCLLSIFFKVDNKLFLVYPQICATITKTSLGTFLPQPTPLSHHPISPYSLVSDNNNLLYVSIGFPTLDVSYRWNSVMCGLLCLTSFT